VTYKRDGEACTISCNLGLWEVKGRYGLDLINEATHYFNQYKASGEYSEIIGGESVLDIITKQRIEE